MDMSGHDHNAMMGITTPLATSVNVSGNGTAMDHSSMNMSGMDHSAMSMGGMDMSGMGDMNMNMSMDMMMMYFHTGIREYILFQDLHTYNDLGFAWACIVIFFSAMFYELLKYTREQITVRHNERIEEVMKHGSHDEKSEFKSVGNRMLSRIHFLQTFLHLVQILLSYCLMLIFMTYNVWLCISLVLGATAGYFLTGWRRVSVQDSNEHCH